MKSGKVLHGIDTACLDRDNRSYWGWSNPNTGVNVRPAKLVLMSRLIRHFPVLLGAAAYLIASLGGQGLHLLEHAVVDHECCAASHLVDDSRAHCHGHHCCDHDHPEPVPSDDQRSDDPRPHDHENCLICLYQSQAQKVALPAALPIQTGTIEEASRDPVSPEFASPVRAFNSRAPPV